MKGLKEQLCAGFSRKVIPFFIFVGVVFTPFSALALNTDLLEGEVYWIDKGQEINYTADDYFQGFSKYITDEEEGCFYLFSRFTDYRIDPSSKDNITLSFTVKNELNSYVFQVNKDGVTSNSSRNAVDAIDIYYNFNEASCKRQGGGIFIAFKLKNDADRALKNTISCEYFCGLSCTYDLFSSIILDMYVPTTTKAESQKTSNQTPAKETTSKSNKVQTTKEQSTKFSASGSSSTGDTTKFYGGAVSSISSTASSVESDSVDSAGEVDSEKNFSSDSYDKSSTLSKQAKILIAIFAVLFSLGTACVVIGTVNSKKKEEHISAEEKQ